MRYINLFLSIMLLLFNCYAPIKIVRNPNITVKNITKVILLDIKCGEHIDCAHYTNKLENAFLKNGIDVLDRKYFDIIIIIQGMER